jgi:hypothetical protein
MGAAPRAVRGERVDPVGSARQLLGKILEDAALTARGVGVEVGDANDDSMIARGERTDAIANLVPQTMPSTPPSPYRCRAVSCRTGRSSPVLLSTRSVSRVLTGLEKTFPS